MQRFDRWMLLFALVGLVGFVATLGWVLTSRRPAASVPGQYESVGRGPNRALPSPWPGVGGRGAEGGQPAHQ
jgi:hypothetical protein